MTLAEGIVDKELVDLAELCLAESGFSTHRPAVEGLPDVLLAENAYLIVAVSSSISIAGLLTVEPEVSSFLTRSLSERDIGAKRWDAYVALLTGQSPSDAADAVETLYRLSYDTRYVRRIARSGVEPTLAAVRLALRPLLPLPEYSTAEVLEDALAQLGESLVANGIPRDEALRAVASFRATGEVPNVDA